jgi:hypothetical protein
VRFLTASALFAIGLASGAIACGDEQRQVRIVTPADSCAGVVRATIVVVGAVDGGDLRVELKVDPTKPNCTFEDFSLPAMQPALQREVIVEGRDSAGQLVIFGKSAPFSDPPTSDDVTPVSVTRQIEALGTLVFTIPSDETWIKAEQLFIDPVGTNAFGTKLLVNSADARAYDDRSPPRRFAVTGFEANLQLSLVAADASGARFGCDRFAVIDVGQIYARERLPTKPTECDVWTPIP